MFHGTALNGEQNLREVQLYLDAGFAVVEFTVSASGSLVREIEDTEPIFIINAMECYQRSDAGLVDARCAVDYVTTRYPEIDARRLYTAGHSSAGSLALLAASKDNGFAAWVAYAPCVNVPAFLAGQAATLDQAVPQMMRILTATSPDRLRPLCRTLVFQATDDDVTDIDQTRR